MTDLDCPICHRTWYWCNGHGGNITSYSRELTEEETADA